MADPIPFRRPINWAKLRTDEVERLVRDRAADTSKVIFGDHAFDRIEDRSITVVDALRILRNGYVEGVPQRNIEGEWEAIIVKRMPGMRDAGVVTIIYRGEDTLFVKTVEWMDWER